MALTLKNAHGFQARKASVNDYQPSATYDATKDKKNTVLGELNAQKTVRHKKNKSLAADNEGPKHKKMRASPSRTTIITKTPAGFAARVAENLETAVRLQH